MSLSKRFTETNDGRPIVAHKSEYKEVRFSEVGVGVGCATRLETVCLDRFRREGVIKEESEFRFV